MFFAGLGFACWSVFVANVAPIGISRYWHMTIVFLGFMAVVCVSVAVSLWLHDAAKRKSGDEACPPPQ
jgi:hypothetical protein